MLLKVYGASASSILNPRKTGWQWDFREKPLELIRLKWSTVVWIYRRPHSVRLKQRVSLRNHKSDFSLQSIKGNKDYYFSCWRPKICICADIADMHIKQNCLQGRNPVFMSVALWELQHLLLHQVCELRMAPNSLCALINGSETVTWINLHPS